MICPSNPKTFPDQTTQEVPGWSGAAAGGGPGLEGDEAQPAPVAHPQADGALRG